MKRNFIPFKSENFSKEETRKIASENRIFMSNRRSIRHFSTRKVDKSVIEDIIMTASTAPSGANKQPWYFCAISDKKLKSQIRQAVEEEEYKNYHGRMSKEWMADLEQFETDWHKEFIEDAPWLIVIFKKSYDINNGAKSRNYYVNESVGIATGMLITAIHQAGLVTLTHTPSPMGFLQKILDRPINEKPYLVLPVGYAKTGEMVPEITKKSMEEVINFY